MQNWLKMFANSFLATLPADEQPSIITDVEQQLRPTLYRDSTWFADYRRIRVVAIKD